MACPTLPSTSQVRAAAAAGVLAVLTSVSQPLAGPPPPRASDGIQLPSQSLTGTDDASSILINPANLAFSTGAEARFLGLYTGNDSPLPARGYSLSLGAPLWILGTGLHFDWLEPPEQAPPPFAFSGNSHRYQWVRWGLALRLGEWAALGSTLAWSLSETPQLDNLFSASAGLTVRPSSFLSGSFVLRDYNRPENDAGFWIDRSVDLGLAVRPLDGRRALEVGVDASYRAGVERWVPGISVAADIPYVGKLRTGVQLLDPSQAVAVVNAGLEVNLDYYQLSGGVVMGSGVGLEGTGFYAGAALRSFVERPSVPMPARVVRVRFEATPNLRQHTRLLRTLWGLADDGQVAGVLLELRTEPAGSLAATEELADAVRLLRARGKRVLCHLEDASGRELFLCAHANRIAINPAGGVRFAGLATRYFYLGGLLDKLGVKADFVRIGRHKLAAEMFTTEQGSDTGRLDHMATLRAVEDVYLDAVARGRGLDRSMVRQRISGGPYLASEARDAQLVDELVYEDEIPRFAQDAMGGPVYIEDLYRPDEPPAYWSDPPKIAVVYLEGQMVDGNSRTIPILDIKLAGARTISRALKDARNDPTVRAVVLRVDTGGGSALAADLILRELKLTAAEKPVVVSMASTAASGGYYAALASRELYANRATITGSIGIFYGQVDFVGLMDKLGVKSESFESAPRADVESYYRPFTDDERGELGHKVKQMYDLFVGRVVEGRPLSADQVNAVGEGRVWTGSQALEHKLVDRIGGLRQAIARARALANLPTDAAIVELPEEPTSLLSLVLDLAGVPLLGAQTDTGWMPPALTDVARILVPFLIYEPSRPMALMELGVREP